MRTGTMWGIVAAAALALAACEKDPAEKSVGGAQPRVALASTSGADAAADRPDPRTLPVPEVDGRPMWSANRRRTAEENAQAAFERNGETFGARTLDDFVAKAHAFTGAPPAGVQKIKRPNGDVELYDPKTNTFAVVTKDGAPRTMFKPDDGAAYWEREKEKAAARASDGNRNARAKSDADEG